MSKINMTASHLRALWDHSQRVGTSGNWPALALDWADAAQAHGEDLAARLAEADALIAKGLAVVHDFLPNIGRCVLQDYQRMNEFCSEAAARTAVSADGGEK